MSGNGVTSLWECECSSKNPLRYKQCKSCGRDMPNHFLSKIYYEELKKQKAFVIIEDLEESRKRCQKVGNRLEKMKSAVVPVMLMLLIVLNVGRIYWDYNSISIYTVENAAERQERLGIELDTVSETMTGLKSIPTVVRLIFSDFVMRIEDVSIGLEAKREESGKHIDYNKFENAKLRIEGVVEYVTSRFE